MPATFDIRPLERSDDRARFSCGEPSLDRFFQHYAGQNQFKLHLAVTYVAVTDARILGFATVAAASLERKHIPSSQVARRLPAYPIPVLRLARLGVDTSAQGHGVGRSLLGHVLRLALDQRDHLGCVGVVTDAKAQSVAFYERYGFTPLEGVREGALHGGPTPMFLPLSAVAAAMKGA